jgi:hypothetical protein
MDSIAEDKIAVNPKLMFNIRTIDMGSGFC